MKFLKKIYSSSLTVFCSMFLGIYLGITAKSLGHYIGPVGDIYFGLLQVAVIPLVIFIIILGIFHIHTSPKTIVFKATISAIIMVFLTCLISVVVALIVRPWKDIESSDNLFSNENMFQPREGTINQDMFEMGVGREQLIFSISLLTLFHLISLALLLIIIWFK